MNPAQAWTPAELNDLRKEYREHSQRAWTFVVFYRRFVEAWVTEINLQSMLGEHLQEPDSIGQPLVRSKSGGWIAKFERPPVEKAIRSAANAESLLVDVTRLGDTRQYAMRTFTVFVVIAILLALVSILIASR